MKRESGVLMPIFALPGKYGCGTFGESAYRFIDDLEKGALGYWQVLPFGITDAHNSPYMSYSSFAGNPFFIDPEALFEMGLVTKEELDAQTVADPYLCDYAFLRENRYRFLKKAALRLQNTTPVDTFMAQNPRIAKSCEFLALKAANGGAPWQEWHASEPDAEDLRTWRFIQYEFHRQ